MEELQVVLRELQEMNRSLEENLDRREREMAMLTGDIYPQIVGEVEEMTVEDILREANVNTTEELLDLITEKQEHDEEDDIDTAILNVMMAAERKEDN